MYIIYCMAVNVTNATLTLALCNIKREKRMITSWNDKQNNYEPGFYKGQKVSCYRHFQLHLNLTK